ncbi:hypothetical protein AVEN_165988-1, partial [Araneus ventricosus]
MSGPLSLETILATLAINLTTLATKLWDLKGAGIFSISLLGEE